MKFERQCGMKWTLKLYRVSKGFQELNHGYHYVILGHAMVT